GNALRAVGALTLQPRKLGGERNNLLVEFLARVEAIFARIGIDAEIADRSRGHSVESDTGEEGFESRAGDHALNMEPPRLMISKNPHTRDRRLICFAFRRTPRKLQDIAAAASVRVP